MAGTTGCDGNPRHTPVMAAYHPPVIPVKTGIHGSAPTGEQECPSSPRHSRENGNPYVLDVGLPLDKPKVHGKIGVVAKTKDPVLARAWQAPGSSRKNRGWYNFRNHRRRDVVLDPCVSPECRAPSTPVGMNTKSARIRRTNFGSYPAHVRPDPGVRW